MTKKLLTFLTLLTLFFGVGWAETVTYVLAKGKPTTWTPGNSSGANSCTTSEAFTIHFSSSNATNANYIGLNQGGTLTISHDTYSITKIVATTSNGNTQNVSITSGGGSIVKQSSGFTWTNTTGSKSITFKYSSGRQLRFSKLVITYEGSSTPRAVTPTFDPEGDTYYEVKTVTITSETEDATIYYTKNGDDPDPTTSESIPNGGTVTIDQSCTLKAIASKTGYNDSYIASDDYTIILPSTVPFHESFDQNSGTGGNNANASGDQWSGSLASSSNVSYDNYGWDGSKIYAGYQCVKLGSGSDFGTITTPSITGLTEGKTYTLTIKAAPWGDDNDDETLNVTATGGTIASLTTDAMTPGEWNTIVLTFTASATSATFTFSASEQRFWIDDVRFEESTAVADGYYLFGEFNDWATGDSNYKFTQQSDGSYKLTVSNYTANKQFKFAKYVNGTSTLIGVNNDGVYGLHSTHHTDIAMNTGDEPYKINDSGEMIFTIHADENAFDVDKQVYMKGTYNSWANEAMTLTADGWTITKQLAADAELGFVDSWGYGIWHGCGDNQNNITVDQDKLDTELALWTDGKNFYFPTAGNYSFTVSRDLSKVVISLVPEPHAINCSVVTDPADKVGGTLVADKETAVAGELVTLTINTENGYTLNSVTVNGETITPVNNVYSFEMPNADANVVANFSANTYAITVVSPNGTTTCPSSATTGHNVSFTVTPNENYTVSSVTATANTGSSTFAVPVTEENGTYKFGMPPFPVTVTVTYTQQSSGGTGEWQLVDDASKLVAGNEYIIVVQNLKNGNNYLGSYALTTEVYQNYLKATNDIELGENFLTAVPGDAVAVFTLEGSENNWMFKNGENYLYNINTSKNQLGLGIPTNDEGVFTITIGSNNIASIVENVDNRGLYCLPNVANNIANPYFSLYVNAQTNGVHLYYRETSAVATPVITPASKVFYEEFDATITCATQGATIYYTTDGTDPSVNNGTPYSTPVHISKTTTLKAIAVLDGETSAIATAEYQCTMVENIAEYNALPVGTTGIVFKNPVIVQYHYINTGTNSGKSYIYVKDDTGCAYFHQPGVNGQSAIEQLENGDIIAAGFYGDKTEDEMVSSGPSNFYMLTNLTNFAKNGLKGLAEPELHTVAEIADATTGVELNNHYVTIKKVKLSALYQPTDITYGGAKYFDIDNVAHIGYNKFNIDWSVVDDLDAYYNITGIQTAYNNVMEFHPTEVVKWAEKEVTLRDLCDEGEVNESYTITNNLIGVKAVGTSLWVKDENGQSIHMTAPAAGDHNYEIGEEAGNKQLDQSLYDQSNWLEIVFPTAAAAQSFETTVIKGYTIKGVFDNKTNPKLTLASDAVLVKYGDSDTYSPNYYCAANFYNGIEGGNQACTGSENHGNFFFMNPKPQEYAMIVWAKYDGNSTFSVPTGNGANEHGFQGTFTINLSMNPEGAFDPNNAENIGQVYNFEAIICRPSSGSKAGSGDYVVYPLNLSGDSVITNVVDVTGKTVAGRKYYNLAGMESDRPFEGVNIIVTTYTDGSRSSAKVLK